MDGERCIDRDEQVTNLVKLETFLYSRNYSRRTTKVQSLCSFHPLVHTSWWS